jgi:aerobic-type carbon monoxide dehydrogenase small subunit (CoxS/CutS family)
VMKGNICRCGTYQDLRKAIHRAAAIMATKNKRAAIAPVAQGGVA